MYLFILFLACFCASTSSIFAKLSDLPSIILLAYRLAITLIMLAPYTLIFQRNEFKKLNRTLMIKTALSGLCFAFHLLSFFEALRFAGVAEVNILVCMEVLFIAVFELLIWKKGISAKGWIFLLLSCVAAYFVISGGKGDAAAAEFPNALLGKGLAVLAALFSAIYTLLGRDVRKDLSMPVYTTLLYTCSLIVTFICIAVQKVPMFGYDSRNFIYSAGLAFFATILGHNLFSFSLKHFKSSMVSSVKLTGPVFSSILAWICFGMVPSIQVMIASVAMIFTIYGYIQCEKD
ncbi:MAG: DMT family transporter [Eubacteriales bacterium]|nr:DMT family transporter [Eubacteriales bacterium]